MATKSNTTIFAYVGTYTVTEQSGRGRSEGIYIYRVDPTSGLWTHIGTARGIVNPSYLSFDPQGRYLYSVIEADQVDGQPGGAVAAYAVDRQSGALTYLNRQSTRGAGPCYVSTDATGRYVLAANYNGGSIAVLPIQEGGRLGPASDFIQHVGSGPHPNQSTAHAHFIAPDPSNRFALVNDLGVDKTFVYRLDLQAGKLIPNDPPYASLKPGAGPRHLAFHPNGRFVYVIDELDNTVTVFAWDEQRGALSTVQCIDTLPHDFQGTSYCADVHFGPTGYYLYGSNRGHDSIVIYYVNGQTGTLELIGWQSTYGSTPRNFAIEPNGQYMYVANQDSDNIVTFRIDNQTGKLTPVGEHIQVPRPVCVKFLMAGE